MNTTLIIWRRITMPLLCRNLNGNLSRQIKIPNRNLSLAPFSISLPQKTTMNIRFKSTKKINEEDSDDENDFYDDATLSKDSKIVKFSTTSMRTDIIIKSALGVARNKIEQVFYESKIRINGKKVMKKSATVKLGDEIDVIKSISPKNPNHIYVSRIEILNITPREDSISITARRFKSYLIENYDADPYKASIPESEN